MEKIEKLKKAIALDSAIKDGKEAFLIMSEIEKLEEQIENIPQVDLTEIKDTLNTLTNKVNEDIEVELQIV